VELFPICVEFSAPLTQVVLLDLKVDGGGGGHCRSSLETVTNVVVKSRVLNDSSGEDKDGQRHSPKRDREWFGFHAVASCLLFRLPRFSRGHLKMDGLSSTNTADRPSRWRFQYSLRSLFLLAFIFAMIVSCFVMYWRMKLAEENLMKAEQEMVQLRNVAGYLKVEDKDKFYAIALDSSEENSWRWRVYIPRNRQVKWNVDWLDIPYEGTPPIRQGMTWSSQLFSVPQDAIEEVVTLSLRKQNGRVWFSLNARLGNSNSVLCDGSIPDKLIDPILEHGGYTQHNRNTQDEWTDYFP
jgi:hypothetical protein